MNCRSIRFIWIATALLGLVACGQNRGAVGEASNLVQEAKAALDSGQTDVAIARLQEALKRDDRSVEAHFVLGNAYAEREHFKEAEEQFIAVLRLDEGNADARTNLGVVYYQQAKLKEAEEAFRAALAVKTTDAEIHYNLGGVLAAQGRFDEAVSEFLEAKEIDPSLPEPYLGLGSVYKLQGKREEAIAVLKEYVRRSKDASWRAEAEQMLRELESGR